MGRRERKEGEGGEGEKGRGRREKEEREGEGGEGGRDRRGEKGSGGREMCVCMYVWVGVNSLFTIPLWTVAATMGRFRVQAINLGGR